MLFSPSAGANCLSKQIFIVIKDALDVTQNRLQAILLARVNGVSLDLLIGYAVACGKDRQRGGGRVGSGGWQTHGNERGHIEESEFRSGRELISLSVHSEIVEKREK